MEKKIMEIKVKKVKIPTKISINGETFEMVISPRKAIKLFCTECMPDSHPKECTSNLCPLYIFRGKTNPNKKYKIN